MKRSMAEPRSLLASRPIGRSSNRKPPHDRGRRGSTAGRAFLDGLGHFLANDGELQQLPLQRGIRRPLGAVPEVCRLYPPIRHILHEVFSSAKRTDPACYHSAILYRAKKETSSVWRCLSLWREAGEGCTLKEQHLTLSTG